MTYLCGGPTNEATREKMSKDDHEKLEWVCSKCKEFYATYDHTCPECGTTPCPERIEAAKSNPDWDAWRASPTEDQLKCREDEVLELLEKISLDLYFRLHILQLSPEAHKAAERIIRRRKSEADKANQVLCNNCGDEMRRWLGEDPKHWDVYGAKVAFSTGYLSDPLEDGCSYSFNLCEGCLDQMFKTFKIPPDGTLY